VGAGTVRAEGGRALWTPEYIYPDAGDAYRELRRALKREASPRLVIVTARGDLNPSQPALEAGAIALTTQDSSERLRKTLPAATEVRAISNDDRIDVRKVFEVLRADGYRTFLTEGGPQLFGQMVTSDCVDELFLTVSPVLAGRRSDTSFGLIHGVAFGRVLKKAQLLSVHRQESHLFLRYAL
jgi:riboflavin biosynthesis pyrimidine reductase